MIHDYLWFILFQTSMIHLIPVLYFCMPKYVNILRHGVRKTPMQESWGSLILQRDLLFVFIGLQKFQTKIKPCKRWCSANNINGGCRCKTSFKDGRLGWRTGCWESTRNRATCNWNLTIKHLLVRFIKSDYSLSNPSKEKLLVDHTDHTCQKQLKMHLMILVLMLHLTLPRIAAILSFKQDNIGRIFETLK